LGKTYIKTLLLRGAQISLQKITDVQVTCDSERLQTTTDKLK